MNYGWTYNEERIAAATERLAKAGYTLSFDADRPTMRGYWKLQQSRGVTRVLAQDDELKLNGAWRESNHQVRGTCHPSGVMVLMADGSEKPIEEVAVGDVVVSHTGQPRKVIDTGVRSFSGDLISIKVAGSIRRCVMTEDHPVASYHLKRSTADDHKNGFKPKVVPSSLSWCSAGLIDVGELALVPTPKTDNDYIVLDVAQFLPAQKLARVFKTPIVTQTRVRPKFCKQDIPRFIRFGEEFGRILGLYAGEGCCEFNDAGSPARISWTFCTDEPHFASEVASWIQSTFGVHATIVVDEDHHTIRVRVANRAVALLFHGLCPGKEIVRKVHSVVMRSPKSVRKAFLRGWYDAEGHYSVNHDGGVRASCIGVSSSPFLIETINKVCASLGVAINVRHRKISAHQNAAAMTCTVFGSQVTSIYPEKGGEVLGKTYKRTPCKWWRNEFGLLRKIEEVSRAAVEELTVYSLEVEEDHSYVADGIAVHNCVGQGSSRAIEDVHISRLVDKALVGKYTQIAFEVMYGNERNEHWPKTHPWGCNCRNCPDGLQGTDAAEFYATRGVTARANYTAVGIDLSKPREDLAIQWNNTGVPAVLIAAAAFHKIECHRSMTWDEYSDPIAAKQWGHVCLPRIFQGTRVDRFGCCEPDGQGGHCTECCGIVVLPSGETAFVMQQSWGTACKYPNAVQTTTGPIKLRPGSYAVRQSVLEGIGNQVELISCDIPSRSSFR